MNGCVPLFVRHGHTGLKGLSVSVMWWQCSPNYSNQGSSLVFLEPARSLQTPAVAGLRDTRDHL